MSKKSVSIFITVILPLIMGAFLYCFMSPDVWFIKKSIHLLGITPKERIFTSNSNVWFFIRYYFFDFLWAFGLASAISILLENDRRTFLIAVLISAILGAVLELMQLFEIALGTFDICDIIVEVLGALVGAFSLKVLGGHYHEKIK